MVVGTKTSRGLDLGQLPTKKQPPLSEKVMLFCLEFNFKRDLPGMMKEEGEAQFIQPD